jgi:hypothetical protein
MSTRNRYRSGERSWERPEAWWLLLTAILKSMRNRPRAWLLAAWLCGWALFAWHALHSTSWDAVWSTLHNAVSPAGHGDESQGQGQGGIDWLYELGRWGQLALYTSTALLAMYTSYALWVWRAYTHGGMWDAREERLQGGGVLEVLVPTGSKADARAASDMFGQLWNLLSGLSRGGTAGGNLGGKNAFISGFGKGGKVWKLGKVRDVGAERLALSLEIWSTPHTDGKVGFYVWCPRTTDRGPDRRRGRGRHLGRRAGGRGLGLDNSRLIEEVRHLIMVHHPGCRVRWVEDPLKRTLTELVGVLEMPGAHEGSEEPGELGYNSPGSAALHSSGNARQERQASSGITGITGIAGIALVWYELGLIADSLYPIGSGASDERLLTVGRATRPARRSGSPGAGSDPLATVIGMLGSDKSVPLVGIQIVAAARPETAGETQQAVNKELARLRNLELQVGQAGQAGKKALGLQHEARVLALEEKADRQGYDVMIRLVAAERVERTAAGTAERPARAEARLASLLRAVSQYNRTTGGVNQGLRVVRQEHAGLSANAAGSAGSTASANYAGDARAARAARVASEAARGDIARAYVSYLANLRAWKRQVAPLVGRWPREGVCLPRMLPFMRMGKPCILNMAELSAIYHFPHEGLESLSTLRLGTYKQIPPSALAHVTAEQVASGQRVAFGGLDVDMPPVLPVNVPAQVPTPAHSPTTTAVQALTRAGYIVPEGETLSMSRPKNIRPTGDGPGAGTGLGVVRVGTYPKDLRRGSYVLGPMGSGKSVFLYNIMAQYMAAGRGVGLIDGKGDSYEEILRLVPPHLEGEVLTFDPENRHAGRSGGGGSVGSVAGGGGRSRRSGRSGTTGGRSIGINPLDGRVVDQLGVELVESMTMGLMRKMMGANWNQSPLMQRFLRDGMLGVLDVESAPTMLNLWRWLQDDGKGGNEYREGLVGGIRNPLVQDFWQHQVPAMSAQQRSSMQNVLTRVDRYVKNYVRYVILQPYSTVNFQHVMDRGTIFVGRVSPRLGEDQSFLGALMLNGFLTGAFARQAIPQEQRRDYLLVVDEFQNFVDTGQADVERMLSMARGYSLGLMLAHQYTEQLPKEVLEAILNNVQTWVLFGLQAGDARRFAGYMEGVEAQDFQNLPPYHTYQRTIVNDTPTGVYSALPLPPPLPAVNPGQRFPGRAEQAEYLERASAQDLLRAAHVPPDVSKLVGGAADESEEARRARIMKFASALYWPAEEGDEMAVQALSMLTSDDLELYRRARMQVLDRQERERILAQPWLVPDKAARIERLSELRWGTPCVEVDALIRKTLNNSAAPTCAVQETGAYGETPGPEEYDGLDIRDSHDGAAGGSTQDSFSDREG